MIGYSKKNRESAFDQKKKKPGLKFKPKLALTGAQPTVLGSVIYNTLKPLTFSSQFVQ